MNVALVRESVRQCRACDLHKVGSGPVPFSGPTPNFLAVVGEAPGRQEDKAGEPFIGPAGQMLRTALRDGGIEPDRVTFINTVSCFPDRTPTTHEIDMCSTNLLSQLQATNPAWVVLLGGVALNSQRPDLKITRARGKVLLPPRYRWKMFVTFHPSFALRQAKAEQTFRNDLAVLAEMMDEGDEWVRYTSDSCVRCGVLPDELAEHDGHLRFDVWGVPYCDTCFGLRPEQVKAAVEQVKVEKRMERSGQLFS